MNDCRHGHHPDTKPSFLQRARGLVRPLIAISAGPGLVAALLHYLESLEGNEKAIEALGHRVLEFVEDLKGLKHHQNMSCEDCETFWGYGYMLKTEVWEKVLTAEEREEIHYGTKDSMILCIACAHKRLERPLTEADFDLKYAINWPIVCAMEIGRKGDTEEGADLEAVREKWKAKGVGQEDESDEDVVVVQNPKAASA